MLRIESTVITTSKTKIIGFLLTSIAFIAIGLYGIFCPWSDSVFPIFRNRTINVIMDSLSVLFFGICTIIFLIQLFGYELKQSGLKIDNIGIMDNSKLSVFGLIPWNDIKELQFNTIQNKHFLSVIVYNPAHYIDRQRTLTKRKEMEEEYKLTGTPINISKELSRVSIDKLKIKIEKKLNDYREKAAENKIPQ